MKKIFTITALAAAMIAAATSCQKEQFAGQNDNPQIQGEGLVFYATLENTDTKTTISDEGTAGYKVSWETTDSISVNGTIYKAVPDGTNPAKATFVKMREGDPNPTKPFTVYYPASIYDSTAKVATLPATQVYKADGNIAGILPMYAKSESMDLNFKNLCGLMKFTLKGTETVRYITVSDTSKAICGEFNVADDAAVLTTDTGRFLSLDCGEGGVALDASTGKDFYVALPAGSYEHLAIEYTTTGGANVCRMKASTTATIERNKVYAFDPTLAFSAADYLCFTCTSGNVAIAMTKKNTIDKTDQTKNKYAPVISLQYYTDKTGWQDFKLGVGNGVEKNDSTSIALAPGEKVCFRAKTVNDSLAVNTGVYNYFTTTTTDEGKVDVSGNIMSLLNGDNPGTTLTHINTFVALFKDCTSIQSASGLSLPATTLAKNCYNSMFQNCTALEIAPTLPATTLAANCYNSMFQNCTALEIAPTLPATTLAIYCYYNMFYGCIALKTAPTTLPATTMAEFCYGFMFGNCTALETAPTLPATTLAKSCYMSMFNGCTALETAPVLPATTLVNRCYASMFWGCTALETAPILPATTLAEGCYLQMFRDCSKLSSVTMLATVLAKDCLNNWLIDAGTSEGSHTLYVDPTMTTNTTITNNRGNFTVTAYSGE